ncbi:MAG: hypothetical protein LBM66_05135 [Bifidobacteriaceae bacterium]|nr:hypothetical protein [Bifidobacteriaceae bacterium]
MKATRQYRDTLTGLSALGHAAKASHDAVNWAAPKVGEAIEWAAPRAEAAVTRGVEAAAPRLDQALGQLGPKLDVAHDRLREDVIPAARAAVSKAADAAAKRAAKRGFAGRAADAATAAALVPAPAAVVAKPHHRARNFFLFSGLVALAGTIAYWVWRRRGPDEDPWAEDTYEEPDLPAYQAPEPDPVDQADAPKPARRGHRAAQAPADAPADPPAATAAD